MADTHLVDIPIISMHMPWANWVAMGWKTIETRTHRRFKSLVGRRIGIHATIKWDKGALDLAGPWLTSSQISATQRFLMIGGAVLCTARVDYFRLLLHADSSQALIECNHPDVARYGLFLSDIQVIEAVPARGRQGIWYL